MNNHILCNISKMKKYQKMTRPKSSTNTNKNNITKLRTWDKMQNKNEHISTLGNIKIDQVQIILLIF